MVVTFCGHSQCLLNSEEIKELEKCLTEIIMQEPRCTFYLGGYGNFDRICFEVLTKLKQRYKTVQRVFVTPYISNYYKLKAFSKTYDEIIYPPIENTPLKFAIDKRNRWMIENSDLLICYIAYSFGGAYKTYKYAIHKKLKIVNLYKK